MHDTPHSPNHYKARNNFQIRLKIKNLLQEVVVMTIREHWVDHAGVRLHLLESHADSASSLVPLLHIPGAFATAEKFQPEMETLAPRRCIAMSQRGRGKSDAPVQGYTWEHHVADVEQVVAATALSGFCLYAFSMGVPSALGFAIRHPEQVKGLIIGDYPARYPALPTSWVDKFRSAPVNQQVVRAIQRESREIPLWDELHRITCPVLIMRGSQEGAILTMRETEEYVKRLRDVTVTVFEGSGHVLWEPDRTAYAAVIKQFLEKIDHASSCSC
jgi:pimeloyl-ACP methyl ester carboxylesterase